MTAVLEVDPSLSAVACKMVQMNGSGTLYDTGDFLRRDGVCEQRGRFEPDDGRYDAPGEVFAPCAGAAVYRRRAVLDVGGFDERFFSYLEDVDLGLRLRLAGWSCAYEPAVAEHAGGGSSWQLSPPVEHWIERNTLMLVAKAFPLRWMHLVAYRQLGWAWHALRERRLRAHLGGAGRGAAAAGRDGPRAAPAPALGQGLGRAGGTRRADPPARRPARAGEPHVSVRDHPATQRPPFLSPAVAPRTPRRGRFGLAVDRSAGAPVRARGRAVGVHDPARDLAARRGSDAPGGIPDRRRPVALSRLLDELHARPAAGARVCCSRSSARRCSPGGSFGR